MRAAGESRPRHLSEGERRDGERHQDKVQARPATSDSACALLLMPKLQRIGREIGRSTLRLRVTMAKGSQRHVLTFFLALLPLVLTWGCHRAGTSDNGAGA